mgnify:FL=1
MWRRKFQIQRQVIVGLVQFPIPLRIVIIRISHSKLNETRRRTADFSTETKEINVVYRYMKN